MSVVVLDGSTVRAFVADEAAFARSVDARFAALDANGDGVLSRAELRRALESFRLLDGAGFGSAEPAPLPAEVAALYDAVFEQFDADHSGAVDRAEFRDEMRRIMLAVAEGLGSQPLQVAVDDEGGSFLLEAAEHEAAAIAAKVEAERKAEADAAAAANIVASFSPPSSPKSPSQPSPSPQIAVGPSQQQPRPSAALPLPLALSRTRNRFDPWSAFCGRGRAAARRLATEGRSPGAAASWGGGALPRRRRPLDAVQGWKFESLTVRRLRKRQICRLYLQLEREQCLLHPEP